MEIKLDWSLHVRWQFRCLIPYIPGLLCSSQRAFPPSSCELRWGQATFSRKVVIKVVLRRLQKPQLGPNDALPLWASKSFTSLRLMTGSKRTASKKPLPFAVTTNYSFFSVTFETQDTAGHCVFFLLLHFTAWKIWQERELLLLSRPDGREWHGPIQGEIRNISRFQS